MKKILVLFLAVSGIPGVSGLSVMAQESSPKPKKEWSMTPEQRSNMATAHEKMAACLRTERPLKDCREEMMKACEDSMGKDGCPMHDMKRGKGKRMRDM